MRNLIKKTTLRSENGDATSTYDCILAQDNIPLKQFLNAIDNSVNGRNGVFSEWWASVYISFIGESWFPSIASYCVYGGRPPNVKYRDAERDGVPSSFNDIVAKYGNCIVASCFWNGGWGGGGYHIKVTKLDTVTQSQYKQGGNEMTPKEAYKVLCEFQMWRRGEGKYKWIPVVPSASPTLPYSPKEVGKALDVAIETLKKEVEK